MNPSQDSTRIKRSIPLLFIFTVGLFFNQSLMAQAKKEALSFDDIRQWRTHSVTLSDDGQWYTTRYTLNDKPEGEKDTITEQKLTKYFDESNRSDVLYIHNTKNGIKYQIPDAIRPIFSSSSEWIAYQINSEVDENNSSETKEGKSFIELKHLNSGFTVSYESKASFQFWEDKNYFITSDNKTLLVYDLENRREHYIGNIGEYILDKNSDHIIYTIASEDKRGNGIYMYHPEQMTTKALQTSNNMYSNLSWNHKYDKIAAYKYQLKDDDVDFEQMKIVLFYELNSKSIQIDEYGVNAMEGLQEFMGPAIKSGGYTNPITWSRDDQRLFIKLKKYSDKGGAENTNAHNEKEESTVQVWHWKDKKLLSERIMDYDSKKNEVFDAVFIRNSNVIIQLTNEDVQTLDYSKGTDQWAIGLDNRKYISDWDVQKNDLYSINLNSGDKKLIYEKLSSSYYSPNYEISPDGKMVVFWDGTNYWLYDFEKDTKQNITEGLDISFIDKEYDKYGYVPSYGFSGWVKDNKAIIVNHKFDLWLLPLSGKSKAQNLTLSVTATDSISFSIEDTRFIDEPKIEDRYIDLSSPIILYAYNTLTKYAGYYELYNSELTELIYKPAQLYGSWPGYQILKSKTGNTTIYKMGDYQNYPEAYLSTPDFSKSKKITNTNPQQEHFKWGRRILVEYTNDDGVPLQGVLSIPDGYKKGQKLPMIVHSYEKFSWRMFRYAAPYLSGAVTPEMLYVSDGYLFLQPDIHFNVGTPHSDMHECIDAAIEKVIELGYVDDQRIGYEGFSFGGHCGMYISTQDNKFAAIAAGAGVSNLVQGFNIDIVRDGSNEQDYYMTNQGRLGTDPTSDTEMYIRESPVFNAQTMDTPLLLFHGTEDKVVQWEHSFGFYSILRFLNKPVVFLSYRGEGHGMRAEENRLDIQTRLKEFFDHYLKDGDPKKWMTEELPYKPKEGSEKDKKNKGKLPKWK